ncbi:hypothetical protein [Erythrobacter crassostreae]|uniref:YcxB-like protein domain-containing protein n=1 Tax=Erythrobacter crassostreae TaxID=2828328 RepID=A0A9X1JLC2_9SPHN|nr:hypothetical protein [Erythrobacter crassostrea]MBV7259990.1 hypothetical protein [Erythrobacter crassostrea]
MLGPVKYHISQDDYLEFAKLVHAVQIKNLVVFIAGFVALIALVAIFVGDPMLSIGAAIGGICAGTVLFLLSRFIILPWRVGKTYREYSLIQEEMTLSVSETDFSISQRSGSVTAQWSNMVLWNENTHVIAIHPTRQLGYIFPKAQIGSDHAEFIRRRLAMNGLPEKAKARS